MALWFATHYSSHTITSGLAGPVRGSRAGHVRASLGWRCWSRPGQPGLAVLVTSGPAWAGGAGHVRASLGWRCWSRPGQPGLAVLVTSGPPWDRGPLQAGFGAGPDRGDAAVDVVLGGAPAADADAHRAVIVPGRRS